MDLRSATKKKISAYEKERRKASGGNILVKVPTEIDYKIEAIVGKEYTHGVEHADKHDEFSASMQFGDPSDLQTGVVLTPVTTDSMPITLIVNDDSVVTNFSNNAQANESMARYEISTPIAQYISSVSTSTPSTSSLKTKSPIRRSPLFNSPSPLAKRKRKRNLEEPDILRVHKQMLHRLSTFGEVFQQISKSLETLVNIEAQRLALEHEHHCTMQQPSSTIPDDQK